MVIGKPAGLPGRKMVLSEERRHIGFEPLGYKWLSEVVCSGEDGTRATGFVKYKKYTYYFNSFGSMVKGLRVINGKIYFFRENGNHGNGLEVSFKKGSIISHRTVLQLPDGRKSMEAGITFR